MMLLGKTKIWLYILIAQKKKVDKQICSLMIKQNMPTYVKFFSHKKIKKLA